MKLRIWLICIALLLSVSAIAISGDLPSSATRVITSLDATWWLLIAVAVLLQFAGHWLRMLRTKIVIDQVEGGAASDQFKALAVGYLFNTLLPLRLGELLRSLLISLKLRMSFLYTLTVVILERAVDLLVIGVAVIVIASFLSGEIALALFIAAFGAILFSLTVICGLVLLVREDKHSMWIIWRVTGWLNETLRNKLRFKIWSLIFGLQQFMYKRAAVKRYISLTVVSWLCYLGAMALIVVPLVKIGNISGYAVTTAAPYVAASVPTTNLAPMASYEHFLAPFGSGDVLQNTGTYIILSWLLLTVPMSVVGLVSLFFMRGFLFRRSKKATASAFSNKLLRHNDISQEFPAFLDSYFSGHELARILHKLELSGELSLVKFFKGGSDAITILVMSGDKLFVKKIIPIKYESRLKAQYNWLKRHASMPNLVQVLGEQRTNDYYAIDLEYDPANVPFFEYLHYSSQKQSIAALDTVWASVYKQLYKKVSKPVYEPKKRDAYIEKHIFGCAQTAAEVHSELKMALEPPTITINGEVYDNLYQIIEKIKKCEPAWRDIATFQPAPEVDGDLAIDNILVSSETGKPLIIDPAPDGNIIEGPVFDMGKLMQSFYCGYEFSFRDEEEVVLQSDNSINYRDHRSHKYMLLTDYVRTTMAPKYLSESEQRAILFHAAALHIRRLKHQVNYNYSNTLKFYAVGVKTLNEFLRQYE